ncbi:YegJ family protein [Cellulophaga sp. L1A9]|uniref:YegJ family protein n=1 Tax=Cellulophaga sp. L1A9 TaxID=2686362 RepID=UPI00131C64E4|nr:DUF2314 domain-containing protein [Cellulophaga sp. L1A9]
MGILNRLFGKKKKVRTREGNPDVYDTSNDNDRMNWAIEKAKLTLHYFEECVSNQKEEQQYFSIKARIEDAGKIEHIWLLEPNFDRDGNIFGVVGNEPIDVTNVRINEKIGITLNEVSDWMIIENGRLIGGYTIRAIRDGLTGSELASFDKNLGGMLVDDGEDYFIPNLETPEGAILTLEQAYDHDDLETAMSCKDFHKEAEFMLKKTIKIEINEELIASTSELLRLSYIKNMQEHGMPKFNGIKRAFKRQNISEENCIITEICQYPDGGKSAQKFNTYKINNQWKVLGLED